jgi:hypothetical protein
MIYRLLVLAGLPSLCLLLAALWSSSAALAAQPGESPAVPPPRELRITSTRESPATAPPRELRVTSTRETATSSSAESAARQVKRWSTNKPAMDSRGQSAASATLPLDVLIPYRLGVGSDPLVVVQWPQTVGSGLPRQTGRAGNAASVPVLLLDLEGRCWESSLQASGQEVRKELPATACDF